MNLYLKIGQIDVPTTLYFESEKGRCRCNGLKSSIRLTSGRPYLNIEYRNSSNLFSLSLNNYFLFANQNKYYHITANLLHAGYREYQILLNALLDGDSNFKRAYLEVTSPQIIEETVETEVKEKFDFLTLKTFPNAYEGVKVVTSTHQTEVPVNVVEKIYLTGNINFSPPANEINEPLSV